MAQLLLFSDPSSSQQLTSVQGDMPNFNSWPWLLWKIWKSRNDLIYNANDQAVEDAGMEQAEWEAAAMKDTSHILPGHSNRGLPTWKAPREGTLKCTVDGAWDQQTGKCGVAWIVRNYMGNVRHFGAKRYPLLRSSLDTEATALSWAVSCVSNLGYSVVTFESDNSDVIKAIREPFLWPKLLNYTMDLQGRSFGKDFSFGHMTRKANGCADVLAKSVSEMHDYYAYLDVVIPGWISPLVKVINFV